MDFIQLLKTSSSEYCENTDELTCLRDGRIKILGTIAIVLIVFYALILFYTIWQVIQLSASNIKKRMRCVQVFMILIELGRIVYLLPFVVTMFEMKEDSNIEKISDITVVLSNFFWIGLAINISGHFSYFQTQLALRSDPIEYKILAESDSNFQLIIDILIACESILGLALVIIIIWVDDFPLLDGVINTVLIAFTLVALSLILLSFCKMSKFLDNIPRHEKT